MDVKALREQMAGKPVGTAVNLIFKRGSRCKTHDLIKAEKQKFISFAGTTKQRVIGIYTNQYWGPEGTCVKVRTGEKFSSFAFSMSFADHLERVEVLS